MNKKVLHTLEFDKILERLAAHAYSEEAKQLCFSAFPLDDINAIEKRQQETSDALNRIFKYGVLSFSGIRDIRDTVKHAAIHQTLTMPELLDVASSVETCARVHDYGYHEPADDDLSSADSLDDMFSCIAPLSRLSQEIRRCIVSENEIADDASPALKSVRRNIKLSGDRVHQELSSMINGSLKSYLMEPVITMRDNRYCVPVRAEYKSQVNGMVHDSSSTGSTLFIEPAAIVKLNNDIRELNAAEKQEILVILGTLSSMVSENAEQILADLDILTGLDYIFARAALALEENAMRPLFSDDLHLELKDARHPLINDKKVVPVSVSLGTSFDLLIVTGPNTGGKTVSLKTVGLLELMGLSGLFIPASDGSVLGVFTEIYADIGDEQSIEQSLSTFSSHMTNIVSILASSDKNSLCLFDELGAGTDPEEGAALAIAVLHNFHIRGIRTMATTHYSELKIFALNTPKVENACCEFDVETLRPTYHLLVGVPGKSNAFAISSRLGLPDYIIKDAEKRMDEADRSFEDVISKLDSARVELDKVRAEAEKEKTAAEKLRLELDDTRSRLQREHDRIISGAKAEASRILSEAKNTSDETIRNIQKYGSSENIKLLEKDRTKLRNAINSNSACNDIKKPSGIDPKDIRIGMGVEIVSSGFRGTIATMPDSRGILTVLCGIIKYKTNCSDLIPAVIEDPFDKASSRQHGHGISGTAKLSHSSTISTELNIIGMTTDDGVAELDRYLDDAYMSHLGEVRIVHGKGTGALRNAVQARLKKIRYVSEFHTGEYGEGDAGVTIVRFK